MTPSPGPAAWPVTRVCLIGYRGTGKSSVGRLLAARLNWPWIDTDDRVATTAGMSIREIFATRGESAFRSLEKAALAEALSAPRGVISVGGGAVLDADNRRAMRSTALCLWLTASLDRLAERLRADPRGAAQRPPLTALPDLEELRTLMARREPLYRETAHLTFDTSGSTIEQVTDAIVTLGAAWLKAGACLP